MFMKKVFSLFLGIFILILSGCSKSPMDKLASDNRYPDMNNIFWGKEQDNKTQLWQEALAYCNKNPEKPNCKSIILVSTISNGSTTLVPLNSNPLKKG